jgi:hypothetical protein
MQTCIVQQVLEGPAATAHVSASLQLDLEAARDRIAELEAMLPGKTDAAAGQEGDREARKVSNCSGYQRRLIQPCLVCPCLAFAQSVDVHIDCQFRVSRRQKCFGHGMRVPFVLK